MACVFFFFLSQINIVYYFVIFFSTWFVPDVIATFPFYLIGENAVGRVSAVLRIPRLLKVLRLVRLVTSKSNKKQKQKNIKFVVFKIQLFSEWATTTSCVNICAF